MHTIGTKAPDTSNLAPLQKLQAETVFMSGFQMSMSKVLMETVMGGSVRGLSERDPGAGRVGYRLAGVDRAQAGNHPRHQRCVWQHRQLLSPDFFGGLMIDLGTCGAASSHVTGVEPGTVIYLFRSQNRVTL